MRPVLIFDLDGTLVDSKKDLTASVNHIRCQFDLPDLTEEEIARFIGNGALMLIRRTLGAKATEANVQSGLQMFLSYYRAHMLDSTALYPGVRETLDSLSDCKLAVLTNKPVHFSCAMLDGLGIYRHFTAVYGGNSFDHKKPHPVGVETLMTEAGVGRDATLMVGDSSVDVQTARNAGIACCGVTFGFQPESLADPAPEILVDRMGQLADRLLPGAEPRP